jgi:hypothetical protein
MSRLVDVTSITDGGSNVVTIGTDLALNGNNVALAPDLASTANGEGASLIGVEDSAGYFTATTVEGVLEELQASIDLNVLNEMHFITTTVTYNGGAAQAIGPIPLDAIITDVRVNVSTAFDGTTPNITVGSIGDGVTILADSDDFDITAVGLQSKLEWHTNADVINDYTVFLTQTGATQGELEVIVLYAQV